MPTDRRVLLAEARYRRAVLFAVGNGAVTCRACPHACRLTPGEAGRCGVRHCRDGSLYALWGYLSYARLDPVERKPLYHLHPGTKVYSIGTVGCTFTCPFCQNHAISQEYASYPLTWAPPPLVIRAARQHGAHGIAFTFNEPVVSAEYVHDVARYAKRRGLYTVMVTNGYISPEATRYLAPVIDGVSVGIKRFDEAYYEKTLGASLKELKKSVSFLTTQFRHVEVSYLVTRGDESYGTFLTYLSGLGTGIPLHLERYFPAYRGTESEPDASLLAEAYDLAHGRGIEHVYVADCAGNGRERTICPGCGATLVEREGSLVEPSVSCHCAIPAFVRDATDESGRCPSCGAQVLRKD